MGVITEDSNVHAVNAYTAVTDSAGISVTDTLVSDTVWNEGGAEPLQGLVYVTEESKPSLHTEQAMPVYGLGESIITGFLLLLFCLLGIRFGNNVKYLAAIRRDLLDVRERGNVFDDTVRETSFLWLMNLVWVVSAGILLAYAVGGYDADWELTSEYEPGWQRELLCIGIAGAYELLMWCAYWITGRVFSDKVHTRMWTKAFSAAQGVTGIIWFVVALLVECYPGDTLGLLIGAGVFFVLIRILFIIKGALIFFNKISSWMVFLCYLCNLEIVPLILTFAAAEWLSCAT